MPSHIAKSTIVFRLLLSIAAAPCWAQGPVTGTTINATTGFQNNGTAPSGYSLAGNGSNFVSTAPGLQDSVNSPLSALPTVTSVGATMSGSTATFTSSTNFPSSFIANATFTASGFTPSGYNTTWTIGSTSCAGTTTCAATASGVSGLGNSTVSGTVVATAYLIACDSNGAIDRGTVLRFQGAANNVTIPITSASGCSGLVVTLIDESAGTVTFNRSSSDTINVYTGAAVSTGQSSFTLSNGQYATLNANGSSGLWEVRVAPGTNGIYSPFGNGSSTVYVTRVVGTSGTPNFTTSSTSATLISLNGQSLEVTIPPSTALNVSFSCDIAFSVASVSSSPVVNFYFQDNSGTFPTSGTVMGAMGYSTGSVTNYAFANFTSTLPRPLFGSSPPAQTDTAPHHVHIAGGVEQPAGLTSTLQLMVSTSASTVTIYRNSFCSWQENAY